MAEAKRGRARPRSNIKRRKLTIALPEEWVEQLDRLADLREQRTGERCNRTGEIRRAIQQYLEQTSDIQKLLFSLDNEPPLDLTVSGKPDTDDPVKFEQIDDDRWRVLKSDAPWGTIYRSAKTGSFVYTQLNPLRRHKSVPTLEIAFAQARLDILKRDVLRSAFVTELTSS
jgi:hypothetical protein